MEFICTDFWDENSKKLPIRDIERSIIKKYRKEIWQKFIKAIDDYKLVEDNDKIAIAISGGKDSLLLAKLFEELQKYSKKNIELEYIGMDPGYPKASKEVLIKNCNYLGIDLKLYKSDVFEVVERISKKYPCYMCARMRRGFLYAKAKELGCNKLALGHHFNDVIETTLINVLYGGSFKTMVPKVSAQNFEGLELIRPLYYIREEDIIRFTKNAGIKPINCACTVASKTTSSKRFEVKKLIEKLKKTNENIDISIFRSAQNINLQAVLGYKNGKEKKDFNEIYESMKEF